MILTETKNGPRARAGLASLGAGGIVALAVVVLLVLLMTLLGPLIAPQDPNKADILSSLAGPSAQHLLGTDASGRNLLSRLIVGSQSAIAGAVLTVAFTAVIGVTVGLVSGWFDGAVDKVCRVGLGQPHCVHRKGERHPDKVIVHVFAVE